MSLVADAIKVTEVSRAVDTTPLPKFHLKDMAVIGNPFPFTEELVKFTLNGPQLSFLLTLKLAKALG